MLLYKSQHKKPVLKPAKLILLAIIFGYFIHSNSIGSAQASGLIKLAKAKNEKPISPAGSDKQIESENKAVEKSAAPYSDEAVKHYNRGVELHQAGFLNQAIGEYKMAIEADSRVEEAYSNLGVIYAAQHNYPKAKEAFLEALKLKPNRPTTLNGLGTVLYAQGQTAQAMEQWHQALVADSKFASAYYNMGNAYEGQKNFIEAKKCYMQAITAAPGMADAYFRLGNIFNKERHFAQAELLLTKAINLAPDGEFVREAKHLLLMIDGRFEKAKPKNTAPHKPDNAK